jgi:hypothetical protein
MPGSHVRDRRRRGLGYVRLFAFVLLACLATACTGGKEKSGTRPETGTAPLPTAAAVPPTRAAGDPLGLKWAWGRDDTSPYIRTIREGSTFFEMAWCDVEPQPGRFDWSRVDGVARSTREFGYVLFLKIRVGSCWVTEGQIGQARGSKRKTASAMPKDLGAYQAFVRSVVQRYSPMGVYEYAIENEPNARNFWVGTAAEYERLVTLGAQAIHSANPAAKVVDAGVSSPAYGVAIANRLLQEGRDGEAVSSYQRYYARRPTSSYRPVSSADELRSVLASDTARRSLDFIAASQRLAAGHVVDVYQLHFYESWQNVPALLDYLRASLPPSFPVQAWEVGMFWPGGPDDSRLRAAEVTKAAALLLGSGVRPVIWLPLSPGPGDIRYSLLNDDGSVRPTGIAVQQLAAAATGATAQVVDAAGASGVAFTRRGQSTMVLWSNGDATLAAPPGPGAGAETAGGAPLSWGSGGLHLGTDPVIITVRGKIEDALRLVR